MGVLIEEMIGRYKIIEEIGRGGLAVVYRAMDTMLERSVAIKMILPEQQQDDKFLRRFQREARTLAQLSHPSIVKILDYGEHQGSPYLVMEYISGGTLNSRMGQAMPPMEAAQLLAPIAHALHHAHQHKVIHRDVKPANILINESGQPMLSDFGIVKLAETDESLTGTGVMVGTPAYMSPEQIQGRPVDARTDVYALGTVLFELLAGRKPYVANTPIELMLKHLNDPVPHARQIIRDLPADVEQVLLKAMAKQPEDRYQDMAAFAEVLDRMAAGEKGLTKPYQRKAQEGTSTVPRTDPNLRKAKNSDQTAAEASADGAALPVKPAAGKKGLWIGIGAVLLIAAIAARFAIGLPYLNRGTGPTPTQTAIAAALATATTPPEPTRAENVAKATNTTAPLPTNTAPATITPAGATETAPAAQPTTKPANANAISVSNVKGLTEMHRLEKISVITLAWTPDGKWIIDTGAKAITIIDPKTMKASGTINLGTLIPKSSVITSDSQQVVTLFSNQIKFYSLEDRKEVKSIPFLGGGANSIAISPDMKTIALGMLDNKVQLHSAADGSMIDQLSSNYGGWCVAFSPDGTQVAAGTSQGALMWETATGTWLPIASGQNSLIKSLAFSHDGKLLAGGGNGMIYLWDAIGGDEVAILKGNFNVVNSLMFSPDDSLLVIGSDDKTVRVWDVNAKTEIGVLKNHTSPVFGVVFSPDGDRIASGANEGVIRLWGLP
jgi:tRNA A-37 threonylcarbamoyl transferase component Bud32/Tol biopolymer transport system component